MHSRLLFLFCLSLTLSTAVVVFAALTLATLPILWIIPAAAILTVAHHVLALVILHCDSEDKRLFSTTSEVIAIVLTFVWLSIVGVAVALAVLDSLNRLPYDKDKRWITVVSAVLSSLETIIIAFSTAFVHKERKSILYREKWEWKTNMTQSQWSVSL